MTLKRSAGGVVLGMLLLSMGGFLSLQARKPPRPVQRYIVEIHDFTFDPPQLTVAPGDTVLWINRDIVPHTATGTTEPWDSGTLQETESWYLVVQRTGHHLYYCRFHPAMKGSYSVQ